MHPKLAEKRDNQKQSNEIKKALLIAFPWTFPKVQGIVVVAKGVDAYTL